MGDSNTLSNVVSEPTKDTSNARILSTRYERSLVFEYAL